MQPKKLKRVIIKEEMVALTGNFIKALILEQFLYWSERVKDLDQFIEEEEKRQTQSGYSADEFSGDGFKSHGWIYKGLEELKDELMLDVSRKVISQGLEELCKNGWLDRRNNPAHRWDRKYQYRPNLSKISADLAALGYHLDGHVALHGLSAIVPTAQSIVPTAQSIVPTEPALPEITIENTNIYMPSNDGASDFSFSSGDQRETNGKKNLSDQEQDELLLFGLYGHQQSPPAGSFAEELENSGWVLRSNIVAEALEAFLVAGRAAGLALPLPNSDSRRKDWYKSLAGHADDWGLESLRGGRYRAVFALAKEGDWLNRIGRPGAIDKALGMVENETISPTVRNEDGSYNF